MPKPIAAAPVTSVTTPAVTPGELFAAYDEKIKALICSTGLLLPSRSSWRGWQGVAGAGTAGR